MDNGLPSIIVTGASGFIGSYFLDSAKEKYRIYAVARRSQKEAGIPEHRNIIWLQGDISNWTSIKLLANKIKNHGGADFIFHLAGYYDFLLKDCPEYELTNITGTRNMLVLAKMLYVKRFIFASSLAITNFFGLKEKITEKSPPDAGHPYAVSKRKGEELMRAYSAWFPCTIVRFAAVFSDWCQYPPLYVFLITWLSKKWNSRILGGKGESAVSYIHISDLTALIHTILEKSGSLLNIDTYIASPSGSTSHRELFDRATQNFFGKKIRPFLVPKALAYPGVVMRNIFGSLTGNPPFEKPWMLDYIDHKLDVDSSYTTETLGWSPKPRSDVLNKLLTMVANMKDEPGVWNAKNEAALRRVSVRPNLVISEELAVDREGLVKDICSYVHNQVNSRKFPTLHKLTESLLEHEIRHIYDLMITSIQVKDRTFLLNYISYLGSHHFENGLEPEEIKNLFIAMNEIVMTKLSMTLKHRIDRQEIHDTVTIMLNLTAVDIEEIYQNVIGKEHRGV